MARPLRILPMTLGAFAALALTACGDGGEDAPATQAAENAPETAASAAEPTDRPLMLDLGGEHAEITVRFPPEAAAHPALYDELRALAEAEAEEARRIAQEEEAYAEENGYPVRDHTLQIAWTTAFSSDAALSLLKTTFVFQGGAHPNTYFAARNWRPDTGEGFGIAELIESRAGFEALSEAAREAIMAAKRERLGEGLGDADYSRDQVLDVTAPTPGNFEPFTLIPAAGAPDHIGGIRLHYSPYELGPYVEGAYHIDVPQAVFAAHAAPPFAALLGGAPE